MKIKNYLCSLLIITTSVISLPISSKASLIPGGRLVIYSQDEPKLLNPLFNNSDSAKAIYNLIFSGLVGVDDNFDYFPNLAISVPTISNRGVIFNDEGMVVTYKIRDLAFWHDGYPISSEDVRFTWQCYTNPSIAKVHQDNLEGYKKIYKIETPDSKTVKLFFKENYANYNELFRFILPRHGFAPRTLLNIDPKHPFNFKPIGSGPFRFVEWKTGSRVVVDVNQKYYLPRPHLDQIMFSYGTINKAVASAVEKGKIHIVEAKNPAELKKMLNSAKNIENVNIPQLSYEELGFNTESPILKNANVRKAIAHSVDREKVAAGFPNIQSTWSDSHPNSAIFDSSLKDTYTYDLKMAQYLLDVGGWTIDEKDGLRKNKDNDILKLKLITTSSKIHDETVKYLQEVTTFLGINLEVSKINDKEWATTVKSVDNYDIALYVKRVAVNGADRVSFFSSKNYPPFGHNYSRFNNTKFEAIFSDPSRINDPKVQKAVTEILKAEVPVLPLFSYVENIAVSTHLNNFRPNLVYGNTWNSSEWWLD